MISDGHAHAGLTNPDRLGGLASNSAADGIVTTTLGYGLGYEALLSAMARGGSGSHYFAQDPDAARERSRRRLTTSWRRPSRRCR